MKNTSVSIRHTARSAFTLIELLVVVSIIALLVSILLPSLSKAKDSARAAVCLSNFHQIGLGLAAYTTESEFLPPYTNGYASDGVSETVDGVTYSEFRQFLLVRLWDNHSTATLRDGGGFLRSYMSTREESTDNVLGCPSIPPDSSRMVSVTWNGVTEQLPSYYFMSYGLNYEQATSGGPSYGSIRLSSVKHPSSFVYFCETTGTGGPYVATWCLDDWERYSNVAPATRHNRKFNALFADSHVESGTMGELYTEQHFRQQQ